LRPLVARTDPVAPVVLVGEAAARPAQHGDLQLLQRGHDVVANAARVGNRGALADPDAVVDQAAEMLRELAVDVAVDRRLRLVRADRDLGAHRFAALSRRCSDGEQQEDGQMLHAAGYYSESAPARSRALFPGDGIADADLAALDDFRERAAAPALRHR